jgi:hypothetical protein
MTTLPMLKGRTSRRGGSDWRKATGSNSNRPPGLSTTRRAKKPKLRTSS